MVGWREREIGWWDVGCVCWGVGYGIFEMEIVAGLVPYILNGMLAGRRICRGCNHSPGFGVFVSRFRALNSLGLY